MREKLSYQPGRAKPGPAPRSPRRVALALLLLLAGLAPALAQPRQSGAGAVLLDLKGPVGPATNDYIARGLAKARDRGAMLVVLRIDTPGGLDTSMRAIIQDILSSTIPVACYVAPSGARAASAGTYILYACHVAAMAPGTNLGAATPIQVGGRFPTPTGGKDEKEKDAGQDGEAARSKPTIEDKVVSDAIAYIRGLAQMRGRNVEWAEKAVREAASLPAQEALEKHVIDLVADDVSDLLTKIDGRKVRVPTGELELKTKGLALETIEPDWRTELLAIITNPNVAYILMLAGIYGLLLEFYNPGGLVPGVVGAISLLLALYAFQVLPVNYAGLGLILVGIAMMTAEAFMPSFGVLGLGGAAAFVFGSVMLLETDVPGYGVSRLLIGSIAMVSSGFFFLIMAMLMRARRRPVVTGREQLIGGMGHVIDWQGHAGHVRIHGEIWRARGSRSFDPGRPVRVYDVEGLVLVVQPDSKRR